MSEQSDLVNSNKNLLTEHEFEVVDYAIRVQKITWLSQERARNLLPLISLGKTPKDISRMTSLPESIIILTMLKYGWKASDKLSPEAMAQEFVNSVLAITQMAVTMDLADIASGSLDPRNSVYVPKSPAAMKDFLTTVLAVNNVQNALTSKQAGVVVNTQIANLPPNQSQSQIESIAVESVRSLPEAMEEDDQISLLESLEVKAPVRKT